jgi:phytoene synthase
MQQRDREQARPETLIPQTLKGSSGKSRSNLLPALLLLPSDRRADALLLGDFCRWVDNIADGSSDAEQKKHSLTAWLEALQPGNEACLPTDFREMIVRRDLDRELLSEVVRGMLMDTETLRYARFEDLLPYCRRVASTVGLLSAQVFGASGDHVKGYAESLGIALQLTNILRDVAEDAAMGRIYIPLEDLERFAVEEKAILKGIPSPMMTHLMNHQAERADSFFAKAEMEWAAMTRRQRHLMRPARLMSAIYRDLLLRMHRDRYDILAKRYRVPGLRKTTLLLRVMTSRSRA